MSGITYVLADRDGMPVEIARPSQGSLDVYKRSENREFTQPMFERSLPGPGVWLVRVDYRRARMVRAGNAPTKVNVSRKITELKRKLEAPNRRAGTGSPGIRGYQQRANAAAAAQENRQREAKALLTWLEDNGQRSVAPAPAAATRMPVGGRSRSDTFTLIDGISFHAPNTADWDDNARLERALRVVIAACKRVAERQGLVVKGID